MVFVSQSSNTSESVVNGYDLGFIWHFCSAFSRKTSNCQYLIITYRHRCNWCNAIDRPDTNYKHTPTQPRWIAQPYPSLISRNMFINNYSVTVTGRPDKRTNRFFFCCLLSLCCILQCVFIQPIISIHITLHIYHFVDRRIPYHHILLTRNNWRQMTHMYINMKYRALWITWN